MNVTPLQDTLLEKSRFRGPSCNNGLRNDSRGQKGFGSFFHFALEQFEEADCGGGEFPAAAVDDADGADQFGALQGNGAQAAEAHVLADRGLGKNADAFADADGLFDVGDVVEFHDGADGDAVVLQIAVNHFPDVEVFVEADKRLA